MLSVWALEEQLLRSRSHEYLPAYLDLGIDVTDRNLAVQLP
jgi:hypothetical protein